MPLLRNCSYIQTVQEILENKDIKTTMIYTHILKVVLRELKIITQSLCSESSVVCISAYKEMSSLKKLTFIPVILSNHNLL